MLEDDALDDMLRGLHCLGKARAQQVVEQAFADAKLPKTWRVVGASEPLPAHTCTAIDPDSSAQTVTLRPGASPIDNPQDTTPDP